MYKINVKFISLFYLFLSHYQLHFCDYSRVATLSVAPTYHYSLWNSLDIDIDIGFGDEDLAVKIHIRLG